MLHRRTRQRLPWLSSLFPSDEDPPLTLEATFVGPEEEVRRWRDSIPEMLMIDGTPRAIDALVGLRDEYPGRQLLLYCLVRARRTAAAERWQPPQPADVAKLLDDASRRFARSDAELLDLLIEVLDQIGADLPNHGDLLWDHQANGGWRPKNEYALQAYLTHELNLRLRRRGVIVNREVMIKPTDPLTGAGERTDILVEATPRTKNTDGTIAQRVAVVIEIKGVWNDSMPTAQQTQLAGSYLPAASSSAGIYLIGWFPLEPWTVGDKKRRAAAAKHDRAQLFVMLNAQAAAIAGDNPLTCRPYLLDVQLPQRAKPQ
jgi:hypothetical protein